MCVLHVCVCVVCVCMCVCECEAWCGQKDARLIATSGESIRLMGLDR